MSSPLELNLSVEANPGVPVRAVLTWPPEVPDGGLQHQVQTFVVMRRQGGVLLVLPENVVDEVSLLEHAQPFQEGVEPVVGPFTMIEVPMLGTSSDGSLVRTGESENVLVVDMSVAGVAHLLVPYDSEAEGVDLVNNFSLGDPNARPCFPDLMPMIKQWMDLEAEERMAFYSAAEEVQEAVVTPKAKARVGNGTTTPGKATPGGKAPSKKPTVANLASQMEIIMSALPKLTDQISALTMKQAEMESRQDVGAQPKADAQTSFKPFAPVKASAPVSSFLNMQGAPRLSGLAGLVGAPPQVRASPGLQLPLQPGVRMEEDEPHDPLEPKDGRELGSPMAQALLEQSKALQTLMNHFQASNSDPMSDLSSSTPTTGIKGTMAREKLQRELSAGTGQFFLKVHQAMQRRVNPTGRIAADLSELPHTGVTLLSYLEKYGGYGQQKELGLIQWSLGHAFDAAAQGEVGLVMDHLALSIVMIEQAALDNNRFHLAWLLRLLDDPPQNLWLSRGSSATGSRRPFAPLAAQSWTTTSLAYMKEAEVLNNKRTELMNQPKPKQPSEDGSPKKPGPKRRPGKGGKGASSSNQAEDQEAN